MDGLEIALPVSCGFCGQLMRLVAAGVPDSVQDFLMMQQKKWITALCQTRWSDGSFLVAQFKAEENDAKLETLQKLFKFECKEVLAKVNASKSLPESKSRTEEIEGLLAQQRAAKRLRMVKTLDGTELREAGGIASCHLTGCVWVDGMQCQDVHPGRSCRVWVEVADLGTLPVLFGSV
eukprot:s3895_g12.t1